MLALAYLCEGAVRILSDRGLSATLAGVEAALALGLFAACVAYARATRPAPPGSAGQT